MGEVHEDSLVFDLDNESDTCNNAIQKNILTAHEAKQIADEANAELSFINSELKEINRLICNTAKGGKFNVEYLSSQSGKTIRKVVEVLENAGYAIECTNKKDDGCTLKIRWGC